MVRAAIRTVLQQGGFGTSGPASLASLPGQMQGTTAAQEMAAAMMQNPAAQAALNPSINPYTLTGQGIPYGAYGNLNQQMFGGNPYLSQMYGFGDPDIAGAVAGVPIGGMLPGMPGMAPILNYLQQQQAQGGAGAGGSDTSTAGGSAGTSGTTSTTQTTPTTTTPASTTTPVSTTTPASTTTTPAATTTTTPATTTTSTTTPLTASQQLQQELQQLASGGPTATTPSTTGTTQSTTPSTTPAATTTTSTVQVPGTSITIPVTTTTNPATGQTTTTSTPAASTQTPATTSGTTPASTAPSTPQQTAQLQYQNWLKSRPTRPTTNTQAGWQQFQQQMQAWIKQAPAGVHMNQGEHRGWGHAGGVFGQQNMQRRGGWMQRGAGQSIGTTGGVSGGGAAGGAGVAAGGAKSRLARACDCEVPPMAADLERTSLSYGKGECNRCTYPFARGQRKPMILGDQFPYLHGYNFSPHEQVYVRTKVVLYGTDELEEEDTEPWVMEDSALVNCDRTGAFVCLMDIDMDYVDGDTARGAGIIEAHGRHSGRYGRQRLDL